MMCTSQLSSPIAYTYASAGPSSVMIAAGGIRAHEHPPSAQLHVVGGFGADIKIGVLAEEGRGDDLSARELYFRERVHLADGQTRMRQVKSHGRISQVSARGPRHHHRPDPSAELQERLHDHVIG